MNSSQFPGRTAITRNTKQNRGSVSRSLVANVGDFERCYQTRHDNSSDISVLRTELLSEYLVYSLY